MTTATAENGVKSVAKKPDEQVPMLSGPRLPYHPAVAERFGIDKASWKALVEAIFPTASSAESVILALSYCKARNLDPFKRVVHIVPIWDSKRRCMVDTVWPGIGELRTTAFRTQEYAGRAATTLGPDVSMLVGSVQMTFPEWAQVTVYRMVKGQKVEFTGPRAYWLETYAHQKRDDPSPNSMWKTRPRGQLEKCAEAAALRAAFPEEIGSDYIPEEVENMGRGEVIETTTVTGSKSNALADRLKGKIETDVASALDESPYNPDAMKSAGEESQVTEENSGEGSQVTEREPGDDPVEQETTGGLRLSDLALAIEGALHEPKITVAENTAQKQQIIEALSEKQLTLPEAQHLQKIVDENAERLAKKK